MYLQVGRPFRSLVCLRGAKPSKASWGTLLEVLQVWTDKRFLPNYSWICVMKKEQSAHLGANIQNGF